MKLRPALAAAVFGSALLASVAVPSALASDGNGGEPIRLRDNCDPAAFPPGLCAANHNGDVGILQLLNYLAAHSRQVLREEDALGWRFDPDHTGVKVGTTLGIKNEGGETHTFTRVDQFSDIGCIDVINQALVGSTDLSGRCGPHGELPGKVVPAGGTDQVLLKQAGTFKFQCFIHPWMRTTVTVEGRD